MNTGKIVQIIGPVLDIEFATQLPPIYNALTVEYDLPGQGATKLTLEVQQHLGGNWVRAVAMSTTEGLKRGMTITDTGKPISMPVGNGVMGRVFNVTGDAVDEQGPVKADKFNSIHRSAPPLVDQSTSPQVLATGIKVIDLICPFLKGGKVGAFGGAGLQFPGVDRGNVLLGGRVDEFLVILLGHIRGNIASLGLILIAHGGCRGGYAR